MQASDRTEALALALGFSAADLAENRLGRLSTAQRERIVAESQLNRGISWIMGAGMIGLYAVGIGIALVFSESCRQELARINADTDVAIKFWGFMACVTLLVIGASIYSAARWRSLGERPLPVLVATGPALRTISAGENGPYYAVRIGEVKFDLTQATHDAMEEGRLYRAHYVMFWHVRLLSAEPV